MTRLSATLLLLAAVAASGAGLAADTGASAANDYSNASNWLCLPGHEDACSANEDATVVAANGTLRPEKFRPAKKAPVDCFYIYPTVSRDPGVNSDLLPGAEEMGVIAQQFARFGKVCTTYAPLYRQFTLTALAARMTGKPMAAPADPMLAYHDVVAAWNYYLEHYNHGRGVVLIGHSQGSGMLTQLIKNEIDGKPIQKQLVLAILGGTRLQVPVGKDVGGDFQSVALCHSDKQVGCVIAFASFRSIVPPPANSRFGKSNGPGLEAACVNPAALGGGSGPIHAYLASAGRGLGNSLEPKPWAANKTVQTPYVSVPGMLSAECAHNDVGNYLAITVNGDPADARVDDISGDVVIGGQVQQDWGLHLIDMNLFMGNMIDIVKAEARAYRRKH
jgi:hypothetical protein